MGSIDSAVRVFSGYLIVAVFLVATGAHALAEGSGFDGEITPISEPVLLRYQPVASLLKTTSLTIEVPEPNPEVLRSFEKESGSVLTSGDALTWTLAGWRDLPDPDYSQAPSLTIEFTTDDRGVLQYYSLVEIDPVTGSTIREFEATTPDVLAQLASGYPLLPEEPVGQGHQLEPHAVFVELLGQLAMLAGASQLKLDNVDLPRSTAIGIGKVDGKPCVIFDLSGTIPVQIDGMAFDVAVMGYRAFDLKTGFILLSDLTLAAVAIDGSGINFEFNAVTQVTLE